LLFGKKTLSKGESFASGLAYQFGSELMAALLKVGIKLKY
jgi:hypothetical protein